MRRLAVLAFASALGAAAPALAGPPYVSDDAEPTETGHWEIYGFVSGTVLPGETDGTTGLDVNYGPVKDVQITAVVPVGFADGRVGGSAPVELAAKYRFIHQSEGSWVPDVAVFPRVFVPTGGRFGGDHASLLLPLWAEKDWGRWSLFGGGGYTINPGRDNRNFWLAGLALTRAVSDRLTLGGEVYHQTADTVGGRDFTGVNVGATYKLTNHWSLLASAGPGVQNASQEGLYAFYVALEAQY